jgi:CBS domain-containing protein
VILQGRSSKETSVAEIMTSDVLTGDPEMTVEQAMRLMTERRIRHLPITEGGRLAGLVSLGDLVKWTITAQEETIGHLAKYITGTYPA